MNRWAVPLLDAKPMSIPEDHGDCEDEPCLLCEARAHLTPEDWQVVEFYQAVSDQVENLTPMGVKDGRPWLALRLADCVAACDLFGIPATERADLIHGARFVNDCLCGVRGEAYYRLAAIPARDLAPPEFD